VCVAACIPQVSSVFIEKCVYMCVYILVETICVCVWSGATAGEQNKR
jgi:hypothetical protein